MIIGYAQVNTIIADIEGNMKKALDALKGCVNDGAEIVVFPELFITGYPPKDLIYRRDLIEANVLAAAKMVEWSKEFGVVIIFGYIEPNPTDGEKNFFNAVIAARDGEIVNKRRKTTLPTYDVFNEDRYFQAGDPDKDIIPFEHKGVQIGVLNCEEVWNDPKLWKDRLYTHEPVYEMISRMEGHVGEKLLIVVNASPFRLFPESVQAQRRKIMELHCARHKVGCLYVNQVGYNDDVGFDGYSFAMNNRGEIIMQAQPFREEVSTYDTAAPKLPQKLLDIPWQQMAVTAMQCGIRDYVNKLGITGPMVIGLSGGIDSALVAFLAVTALGPKRVIGVGMPSEFSSDHSKDDARQLARKLGIRFALQPILPPHQTIRNALDSINAQLFEANEEQLFGRLVRDCGSVEDSGVTDENIQARIRGVYLMGLANYYNGMVLSTGNKSEMAVGYCTIYGDMCGGLAVISDLMKTKVFDICRWINENMRDEVIPWNTINKPPSAELRPGQTDQETLPPYETLDEILMRFVELGHYPEQIVADMCGYDAVMQYRMKTIDNVHPQGRDLTKDVYWVCQTVVRNEFKRKQAPTGLKLTNKLFKAGWEYPIVHKMPTHGVTKQVTGATAPFAEKGN